MQNYEPIIQACLHVPVCKYKKEDSDFKDYPGQLIGEKRIHPYSGGTKWTDFHFIIVSPSLKVCYDQKCHSCWEMSRIKIIMTKTTPANATVTALRGKCDSVTACSPLSGPVQRLKQPAIYANTDEILGATILDERQRRTTPNSGYTNSPDRE